MNLANFGAVRWTAYLRPPATKEGKRERNMVVVMLQVKVGDETDSGVMGTRVSDQVHNAP